MSSAKVLIAEIDKSSYIPESSGVYGAMVLPLVRGNTSQVGFATSEQQFLSQTTPEGRIEPGMDLGYYQALDFFRGSNKLLYVRAANGATFGGVAIPRENSNKAPTRLDETLVDPLAYSFGTDDLFLLHATSEGNWSRHAGYKILPYTKLENAFVIQVFWKTKKIEEWIVSRDTSAKNGSGQSMYIETVLNQSSYVRAVDNVAHESDVLPIYLEQTTTVWSDPEQTQAYTVEAPAEPKHETLQIAQGNFLATSMPLNLGGIPFLADAGATASSVASDAANADFSLSDTVEVLTANDGKVDIFYSVDSGSTGHATDFMATDDTSTAYFSYTSATSQSDPTKATETYTATAANGDNQMFIVVEGVTVLIAANATVDEIATAVEAKGAEIVAANSQIESVTASVANVVFTYALTTDYIRPVRVTVGAAIKTTGLQVTQSYSPGIGGAAQEFRITITGNATANGNFIIGTDLGDISVSLTAGQSSLDIATAISTSLSADDNFNSTVSGTVVDAAFVAVGVRNVVTIDPETTGVTSTSQTTTTGKDAQAPVLKKTALTIASGNTWSDKVTVNILDTPVTIESSATSPAAVATAIAAGGWGTNPLIDSVTALGDKVIVTFADATVGLEDVKVYTGLTELTQTPVVLVADFEDVAEAKPATYELQFTSGNSSSKTEIVYINDIPVVLKNDSNTPAKIVDDLISANLTLTIPGLATVVKSSKDPRTAVFTFDISAGESNSLTAGSGASAAMTNGGGINGLPVTDSQMILGIDLLKDQNFNVSMDAGWTSPAFQKALASEAERKMDHIAILSTPYTAEANSDYINAILDYRKNELNLDTSYAALFTGHFKIRDKFNDRDLWIAPTGGIGAIASNTIQNYEPWQPFAGAQRGKISWPTDIRRHFSEGEMDILQDNQVNPILFDPGKGIKLWGQMTLQSFPSALDRINVRLLCIYVEMAMKEYLQTILFELNTEETRARVVASADKFMESIKSRKGVYAFENVCDLTNNTDQDIENNRLVFQQYFEPVKSIETIKYEPIIMSPGTI